MNTSEFHSSLNRRFAFTLVELLVVIAIIGILIGMLLPAVQGVREAARRVQCANNQKQLALGLLNYEDANSKLPPGSDLPSQISGHRYYGTWVTKILPFMEQENLLESMGLRNHVNVLNVPAPPSGSFGNAAFNDPSTLNCPADPNNQHTGNSVEGAYGNYVMCATNHSRIANNWYAGGIIPRQFKNGVGHIQHNIRLAEAFDGTSNCVLTSELINVPLGDDKRGQMFYQVEPTVLFSTNQPPNTTTADRGWFAENFPGAPAATGGFVLYARSYHRGGVNCSGLDGSVHFVSNNIDQIVFQNLGSILDGNAATNWN